MVEPPRVKTTRTIEGTTAKMRLFPGFLLKFKRSLAIVAVLLLLSVTNAFATNGFIVVASTTSTVNSGLFKNILPKFTKTTGISVRVLGVGTGQAIKVAERGDADILFVHHKISEVEFVKNAFGVKRYDVMYNDFIVVGPQDDPADVQKAKNVVEAYKNIAAAKSIFVSRGDESGTHKKSLEFWRTIPVDLVNSSGKWYREAGSGMGATLNLTSSINGYTLTDRSTWMAFQNKGSLVVLFEGDPSMRNQYGITMVNPARHKHVKAPLASTFIGWVISNDGQAAINDFRISGKQTFFANAAGYKKIN